jgi:hypothetical protein
VAIGKPIRPDGHFALLSDQGDRDAQENRPSQVSCKHFVVPSTMSPHADLARSPVGLADKVWLEAMGREPGEYSPWYRSHVLAQRPKLATETLIPQVWLNLALSDATAAAVQTLRADAGEWVAPSALIRRMMNGAKGIVSALAVDHLATRRGLASFARLSGTKGTWAAPIAP